MKIVSKVQNPKIESETVTGFLGGLNAFQDETLIKEGELTEAKNIILDVDGVQPRPGTSDYGSSAGSKVVGAIGFYKSDGTNLFIRYCTGSNNKLQKYVAGVPTDIGSQTYSASARMNFVQARDKVFTFNGVDALSYYDGSTITTYTAMTTPVGLSVTPQGTAGTTAYSYRVSAFNTAGETLACTSVATATGNATLNATNFNRLAWTATAGATGYNIFGRNIGGVGETWMATVYLNTYDDKGQDTPSLSILPPDANTSAGVICSMAVFGISRIFSAGDPSNPSRLYFSGVGDQITNFSASALGGGYIDVFKSDGQKIRAILPFQGGIIIWKDNAIYKFSFASDGSQLLEEITRSFGGISFRSCKHVENDVIFAAKKDGRLAFYSLGNQENYAASILRTNELSIKVSDMLQDVDLSLLENSAAFYFRNIYGCAITTSGSTTNDRVWCLDTRFGSWVYWEGITPNFFSVYIDSTGSQDLYYGDEATGYMRSMFEDIRLDGSTAISVEFATKAFNQKRFSAYKQYLYPVLQFKDVTKSGELTGEIYLDGQILSAAFAVNQSVSGGTGLGAYLLGGFLLGEGAGYSSTENVASDNLIEIQMAETARSIKYNFRSNSATDLRFKFLSLNNRYMLLEGRPLGQETHAYTY